MSKLFVVPTPIGNLEDMSFRAVRILKESDLIVAEDTRTTAKLLQHYEVNTPMQSHHMHNEHQTHARISEAIHAGKTVALVSDAGMPGISDPGFLLIRSCIEKGVLVEVLPGASASITALVESGLPCDRFAFEGFLPVKKGRQSRIAKLAEEERTLIFFESPHRIVRTLSDLCESFGSDRPASLSRELSKKFHETLRASLGELVQMTQNKAPKGEIVLVVGGKKKTKKESK